MASTSNQNIVSQDSKQHLNFNLYRSRRFEVLPSSTLENINMGDLRNPSEAPAAPMLLIDQKVTSTFKQYLQAQGKQKSTIKDIVGYSKRFGYVLDSEDASALLTLSDRNKFHAMLAIANLAKYTGRYDQWLLIRKRYNLKWSKGDSLQHFQRFFNPDLTLDAMLEKVREMIRLLPGPMSEVIRFAALTGLRPSEACESVRLINGGNIGKDISAEVTGNIRNDISSQIKAQYYDRDQQTLRHYLYPDVFLRTTKKAYISYLSTSNYQRIASLGSSTPTLSAITSACRRRNIKMEMKLCRRVFSSWLLEQGIPEITIDMLSGRVSTSVFARHYATPVSDMKARVLAAVEQLAKKLEVSG